MFNVNASCGFSVVFFFWLRSISFFSANYSITLYLWVSAEKQWFQFPNWKYITNENLFWSQFFPPNWLRQCNSFCWFYFFSLLQKKKTNRFQKVQRGNRRFFFYSDDNLRQSAECSLHFDFVFIIFVEQFFEFETSNELKFVRIEFDSFTKWFSFLLFYSKNFQLLRRMNGINWGSSDCPQIFHATYNQKQIYVLNTRSFDPCPSKKFFLPSCAHTHTHSLEIADGERVKMCECVKKFETFAEFQKASQSKWEVKKSIKWSLSVCSYHMLFCSISTQCKSFIIFFFFCGGQDTLHNCGMLCCCCFYYCSWCEMKG